MVGKIDFFMPPRSQYGVLHHFTEKLAEAFTRQGVESTILEAEWNNPKPFLDRLLSNKPDCTLSFNGLLPDDEGRFFCDLIGIPHVAFLVDSQNQFFPLIQSPNTIISCTDRYTCDFFKGIKSKNVLFVPHGVERELTPDREPLKTYDVVMLNSLIDYEEIRDEWKERYPPIIRDAMNEAIEATLADNSTWYVQAFVYSLDRQIELKGAIDPRQVDFPTVFDDLEMYLKGVSRIQLLRSIKDAEVHVFGAGVEGKSWSHFIGKDMPNIIFHEPVPYGQAMEIIKQSKIVLNICPWIRNGSHERVLVSLALGALPLTDENLFFKENFVNGKEIAMFSYPDMEKINDQINEYLSHDSLRDEITKAGREKVLKNHTWDARARQLIEELTPILHGKKSSKN